MKIDDFDFEAFLDEMPNEMEVNELTHLIAKHLGASQPGYEDDYDYNVLANDITAIRTVLSATKMVTEFEVPLTDEDKQEFLNSLRTHCDADVDFSRVMIPETRWKVRKNGRS